MNRHMVTAGIGVPKELGEMPRPMRVKMFMDAEPSRVEEQINAWLDKLSSATIIKTETVVTAIGEKPTDGTFPCIVVTIWYEPAELD